MMEMEEHAVYLYLAGFWILSAADLLLTLVGVRGWLISEANPAFQIALAHGPVAASIAKLVPALALTYLVIKYQSVYRWTSRIPAMLFFVHTAVLMLHLRWVVSAFV